MNWVPNCISFYVDDHLFMTRSTNDTGNSPFNQPMFFILNLAVGGTFPGSPTAATLTPMNYLVDYVRVYHLTGVPAGRIVSLFVQTNRKFGCAESAGTGNLVANRTAAGAWESFGATVC
jgi:beta-glucanase (GH16 family)